MKELTLFFADDHKIVRDGLRVLTEREKGCRVIGEAADGRALVEGVLELRPDVVVTDMASFLRPRSSSVAGSSSPRERRLIRS